MWQYLSLTSLGVIESAELELGPGFNVITGETGAGKTMVVTALGLLRGQRADSALVRKGATSARVEATVDLSADSPSVARIEDAGGVVEDGQLILGRTVSSAGRSRATLGGATVPAGLLSDVTDELVAVHGQSDQHRLLQPSAQRAALDRFAGEKLAHVLAQYQPLFGRLRAIDAELHEVRTFAQERARELDLLTHGLNEIESVAPEPGEDEALRQEEARLAHGEALVRAATFAHESLSGDVDDGSAHARISQATAALDDAAGHDAALDALASRLRELAILVDDIAAELSGYAADVDIDPARLAVVQERRAALTSLQRKYGPTLDDVLQWQETSARRAQEIDHDDVAIAKLENEREQLIPQLTDLALRMSQIRSDAAETLGARVQSELASLAMPSATLRVQVTQQPVESLGPDGIDDIEFLFSANPGLELRALNKGASGGELSRLMLGLEVVLADQTTVPTMVFDEVDAGIGGAAAIEVGRRLAQLAKNVQVVAVTHLPQVAAFADHHFHVTKAHDGAITKSSIINLTGGERVDELARMLAGMSDSQTAQAHARELLALASTPTR